MGNGFPCQGTRLTVHSFGSPAPAFRGSAQPQVPQPIFLKFFSEGSYLFERLMTSQFREVVVLRLRSPAGRRSPRLEPGTVSHLRAKLIITRETRQKCWKLELLPCGILLGCATKHCNPGASLPRVGAAPGWSPVHWPVFLFVLRGSCL